MTRLHEFADKTLVLPPVCLPRAILRGVQADTAGAQCPPLSCGVHPSRDGLRGGHGQMRKGARLNNQFSAVERWRASIRTLLGASHSRIRMDRASKIILSLCR